MTRHLCNIVPRACGAHHFTVHCVTGYGTLSSHLEMQTFPQFLYQGKHIAHSLGKMDFADQEDSSLDEMYGRHMHNRATGAFIKKVHFPE